MPVPNFVHFTTGPATVLWGGFNLGFSEDGVQLGLDPRWADIYSDDMGGTGGVPADAQFLGVVGSAQCMFTKYDKARLDQMLSFDVKRLTTPTIGMVPPLGSFARQDGLSAALQLVCVNEPLTFSTAFLRSRAELNSGTRYRRYVCGFELWINQTDLSQLSSPQARRLFTMG